MRTARPRGGACSIVAVLIAIAAGAAFAARPTTKNAPRAQASAPAVADRETTLWEFDARGCLFAVPTVAGDRVYIGSCAGDFVALDRDSGTVRWSYDIDQDGVQSSFHGNGLVRDDLVLTSTDAAQAPALGVGLVYAFERATGTPRWKYKVRLGFASDIVGLGPRVYALTLDYRLLALEVTSGRLLWSFDPGRGTEANSWNGLAVAGDRVYFGGADSVVYALDAVTGAPAWKRELGQRVTTGFAVIGRSIYFATADSVIHRLDTRTGATVRDLMAGEMLAQQPAVLGDSLIYFGGYQSLTCVDRELAGVRWRRPLSGASTTTGPAIRGGEVLTGTEKGDLVALGAVDGAPRWTGKVPGLVRGIGVGENALYISTLKGTVVAYRPGR
jgi:outer membrane protein assembly factor BamB